MARLTNIKWDELFRLAENSQVDASVRRAANEIARNAQRRAPRDKGEGARSIHAERVGPSEYRVSWDAAHEYMKYPEFGTRTQRAQPHLRPAVNDVKGGR